MRIIYVNCRVKKYMKVDHRSYRMQLLQLWKESLMYGIWTLDLCYTGAVLLPIELTSQLEACRWIGDIAFVTSFQFVRSKLSILRREMTSYFSGPL